MSRFSKYFINTDVSNFTKVYDFNTDRVYTHSSRGIWNSLESSNYQWRITVNCFLNDVLMQVETLTGVGKIIYDITFPQTYDKVIINYEIFNPEVITSIVGWYDYPNYGKCLNSSGFSKMTNLKNIGSYRANYQNTPTSFFEIIPNINYLDWDSLDIFNFDNRFFEKDLSELISLVFYFPFSETNNYNEENLKKAPNLETLIFVETRSVFKKNNFLWSVDSSFDYPLKEIHLRYSFSLLTYIPEQIKYYQNLDSVFFGRRTGSTERRGFDFTYPLIDNQPNLKILKIAAPHGSLFQHNSDSTYDKTDLNFKRIIFPQNIDKLPNLHTFNTGLTFGDDNDLFLEFVSFFYERIYNETNSNNYGYSLSVNSSFFGTLDTLPFGFVHPSFRNCTVSNSTLIDSSYLYIYNQIILTGFNLTANF
jgi:hypothetical protein